MTEKPTVSDEPIDRLTTLCDDMIGYLEEAGNEDVKAIVFLSDAERGGIVFHGYEDTTAGMVELFLHLKQVFASQGKKFGLMTDDGVLMLD
jgi:hypothetical protein